MTSPSPKTATDEIVFLFGIMPRSGTNMMHGLLDAHPQAAHGTFMSEDFLLANADRLRAYVSGVEESWAMLYGSAPDGASADILRSAWSGLEEMLRRWTKPLPDSSEPTWMIARTPSIDNLDMFGQLTDSKAVVIVRDGRSVLESGMRSFGWPFEEYLQRWAAAARVVRLAAESNDNIHVVKYEELLADKRGEMKRVFEFLGVSDAEYPYETEIPVYGSSDQLDRGQYWEGHAAPQGFDPLNRWHHWDVKRRARFAELAGEEMELLGYDMEGFSDQRYRAYNTAMDISWPLRRAARTTVRTLVPRSVRGAILWKRGEKYRTAVKSQTSEQ